MICTAWRLNYLPMRTECRLEESPFSLIGLPAKYNTISYVYLRVCNFSFDADGQKSSRCHRKLHKRREGIPIASYISTKHFERRKQIYSTPMNVTNFECGLHTLPSSHAPGSEMRIENPETTQTIE